MGIKIECRVYSARKQNMNVDAGTTVGQLRLMLYGANYDTAASRARVFRDGDIYIGRLDGFQIKEGDEIEFNTDFWNDKPAANYNHQPIGCTCGCARPAPAARPVAQKPAVTKKPTTIEELYDRIHDDIEDLRSDVESISDEQSVMNDNIEALQGDMEAVCERVTDLENARIGD